jgi:hypothetical protein
MYGTDQEMSAVLDHLESATIAVSFPVLIPGSCARIVFFFVSFRERAVLFRVSFLVLISVACHEQNNRTCCWPKRAN